MFRKFRRAAFIAIVGVCLAVTLAVAAGASTAPSPLKNVGGRTPATKVTLVTPGSVITRNGKVWATAGQEKLTVTITGGAGVTPAFCHEDSDEKYFCYIYRAFGTLTGNFVTTSGRHGKLTVNYVWDFYDQAYPYARLVPGNVTSFDPKTWVRNFYGAGAAFSLTKLTTSTTYTF